MEKARTQARLEVLDADWRAVGIIVNLANDPRNQRAERQRKARVQQRRAARRRRRLRTLCGWLAAFSLIAAYGCVSWVESDGDLLAGIIRGFVSIGLFALFATLNGAMVW